MTTESPFDRERYIAPISIAEELDVPIATVRRWIERGDLPTVHIDRAVRIPVRDYRDWLRKITTY